MLNIKSWMSIFSSLCISYMTQTSGQMTLGPIRKKDLYLQTETENYINICSKYGSNSRRHSSLCSYRILLSCLLPLIFFGETEVNREKWSYFLSLVQKWCLSLHFKCWNIKSLLSSQYRAPSSQKGLHWHFYFFPIIWAPHLHLLES